MSQEKGIHYSKLNKEQMAKVVEQVEARALQSYEKQRHLNTEEWLKIHYPDGEPTSTRSSQMIRSNPNDARTKIIAREDVTYYFSNHPNAELRGTLKIEKVKLNRSEEKHPLQRPYIPS